MIEPRRATPADLDRSDWGLLSSAVRQLEWAWRAGQGVDLASLVPAPDNRQRACVLAELIKVDQEFRWKAADRKTLEQYLADWSELATEKELVAELLEAECLTRAALDAIPTVEELRSRFFDLSDDIDLPVIRARVERERAGGSQALASVETSQNGHNATLVPPPVPAALKVGQKFGRYEIRGCLGQGAMGAVYRAYHPELDVEVALKIPRFDPVRETDVLERSVREGQAAAKVRHPNVCSVHDAGRVEGMYYIAMDLIDGESLAQRIKDRGIDPKEAAELVCKLATGLAEVHAAGVIHRDIKPQNVMIDRRGEPILMDFGLARKADAGSQLSTGGGILGTPAYMPPEQVNGELTDERSDVYSLGVTLYELLTGQPPFTGTLTQVLAKIGTAEPTPPRSLRADLDSRLEAICLKAMAKNPADRYQSAGEMAETLHRFLRAEPLRAVSPWRRRPVWITAASAAAMVLLGVIIYLKREDGTTRIEVKGPDAEVTVGRNEVVIRPGGKGEMRVEIEATHDATRRADQDQPEGAIERWIETDPKITGIQVARDGSVVYAAYTEYPKPSRVQSFEVSSGKLLQTIQFKGNTYDHHAIALSADDRYFYVNNYFRHDITRVGLRDRYSQTDLSVGGPWSSGMGISPDNRRLVVLLGQDGRSEDLSNDSLAIVDITDGKFTLAARVELADEPVGHHLAFSADSRFAYIVTRQRKSNGPRLHEIRLAAPYEVTRSVEFPKGRLEGIAVASQLNRVFVSDQDNRKVWVVDSESFKPVRGIELDGYPPGVLAMSPSGDVLVVLCPQTRRLFCLRPDDGTLLRRLNGLRVDPSDVAFSSDSRYLFVAHSGVQKGGIALVNLERLLTQYSVVFASNRSGESYQLYLMGSDGKNLVRLTKSHATDRSPRCSPNGRRIAFVSDRQGPPRILICDRKGEIESVLEKTDPVLGNYDQGVPLDWSADGRQIAFIGDNHRAIRAVEVKTGEVRTLIQGQFGPGYAHHWGLCWRKSDGAILLNSQAPGSVYYQDIFQVDPETRGVVQVTHEAGSAAHFSAPAASPDGKKIAVLRHANLAPLPPGPICLMAPDATGRTLLTSTGDRINGPPRWSPDGKHLVYAAVAKDFHHISVVSVSGGQPVQLTNGDSDNIEPDVCLGPPPAGNVEIER
jgi:DNA-binding beta-propeller fold protein YncE